MRYLIRAPSWLGIVVVLFVGGCAMSPRLETVNLLVNPGAEEGEETPAAWFAARVPADELRMWRATDQAYKGEASFAISNAHEYEQTVCNNWAQHIQDIPVGKTLQLHAYVKTADAEAVNLCIQCRDQTGQEMLASASTPTFSGDRDWFFTQSEPVVVPAETASITVRAVLTGKGEVWFDDVSLHVVE